MAILVAADRGRARTHRYGHRASGWEVCSITRGTSRRT